MRILIYGINYSPELTGIGKYTGEMAEWLAEKGHSVKMITAKPYYPEWSIRSDYKKSFWRKEKKNGVRICRAPLYVPSTPNSVKRIVHEISFQLGAFPYWLSNFFQKKYDVVICITPAFHLGFLPFFYSKIRRSFLLTHIQDLQVDAAKELGMIKNEIALSIMFKLEQFLLKNSNAVSSISNGMIQKIQKKELGNTTIISFPNWVDSSFIRPLSKSESLKSEFGFTENDKVLLYSGNLGEKQGLEILIHVASRFVNEPNIKFLICGSGGNKVQFEQMATTAGLNNIIFSPLQPIEKLPYLLAMADAHFVLQKKSASDLVMPSKLTGILASGGLAIVSAVKGTSLYEVVKENEMGIIIEPESVEALEEGIKHALNCNSDLIRQNALSYARKHLDKEAILSNFESFLIQSIKEK